MVVGPGWQGETPPVSKAFRLHHPVLSLAVYRTQLFNLAGYAQCGEGPGRGCPTLSAYLKQPAPAAPEVNSPVADKAMVKANFLNTWTSRCSSPLRVLRK